MSDNRLIPDENEIKALEIVAKNATDSQYFSKLGSHAGIFSICMYAREIGVPVMSALFGGMQSIMGKITISPQLMNSMIRKGGHKLEIHSTDTKCTIKGTRKDTGETCTTSFTIDEAKKAGIFKAGGGWDKYPSDMCFARALSRLARRLFPDVIGMSYVEGEISTERSKEDKETSSLCNQEESFETKESQFYEMFEEMGISKLKDFLSTQKNKEAIITKALEDPERFKEWFIEKFLTVEETKDNNDAAPVMDKTMLQAMEAMKQGKI